MISSFVTLLFLVSFAVQLILDSSYENFLSSLICFLSATFGLYLTSRLFRGPCLSSIALVGFQASYFWLPLIALSIELKPISYNLVHPIESFSIASLSLLVLFFSYYLALCASRDNSFKKISFSINTYVKNNIRLSTKSFFVIISLALLVRVLTTGLRVFGRLDSITKIIDPVTIFGALSLVSLFSTPSTLYLKKFPLRSFPTVIFLLTILFTLPSLSRFNILIIVANTLILLATSFFYPMNTIKAKKHASRLFIKFLLLALLIFPVLDRIADGTAYVRFSGMAGGGPIETAQKILNAAINGDKHIPSPTYSGPHPWDESYSDSTIFKRFISTNYLDLSYRYFKLHDTDTRKLVHDFEIGRIISLAPDPIINIFTPNFDKEEYINASFGDFNYYVISGVGLRGFRTGSLLISLMIVFGIFWPLALLVSSFCVLIVFNLLSPPFIPSSYPFLNYLYVGPLTVCLMYESLVVFTSSAGGSEALSRIIALLFRIIPIMAIYFSILARPSRLVRS